MDKVINRKGISLVALVITIIVLIILTAAVVVTGINTPRNTEYAIKMHNQSAVQDAVTLYIMTSMLDGMDNYDPSTAGSYTVKDVDDIVPELYNISSKQWTSNAATKLGINLTQEELQAVFTLDSKGVVGWVTGQEPTLETDENNNQQQPTKTVSSIAVSGTYDTEYTEGEKFNPSGIVVTATYSDGSTADVTSSVRYTPTLDTELTTTDTVVTITYQGKTATVNISVEEAQATLPNPNWTVGSLNATTPYVQEVISGTTYYAPIPKGFIAVEGTNISTGLVIQDSSANQFVWVPVNDSYTMVGDATGDGTFNNRQSSPPWNYDIPYLSNDNTTALAYWQASENGHTGTITGFGTYSEPYSSAGSWETTEYQAMVTSVLKYGGFYVGRYETGGSASAPVVKSGVKPITSIKWNSTDTMTAEPTSGTATYVARNMYPSTSTTYGVASTLIYGIQWDSIMCWAECYNNTRATNTYSAKPSPTGAVYANGTTYDVNKNIYDLAGNVREWSMEAGDTTDRVYRGGYCHYDITVSFRNPNYPTHNNGDTGFRAALYVK